MTEPPRTRRGLFRSLLGEEATPAPAARPTPPAAAPPSGATFSLARFYASRREAGETTGQAIPEFELGEAADFGSTPVGSPDVARKKP
jgi:hypothetical protein